MDSTKNIKVIKYTNYLDYLDCNILEKILKINCQQFKYITNEDLEYNLNKYNHTLIIQHFNLNLPIGRFIVNDTMKYKRFRLYEEGVYFPFSKSISENIEDYINNFVMPPSMDYINDSTESILKYDEEYYHFNSILVDWSKRERENNIYERYKLIGYVFENEDFEDLENNLIKIKQTFKLKRDINEDIQDYFLHF
eukprot:SAG11_NODE_207_length_12378_cov_8.404105_10_plen_195_part_00